MGSLAFIFALGFLSAAAPGETADKQKSTAPKVPAPPPVAVAHVQNGEGKALGDAVLRETPNGVLVTLSLRGLPPGSHAFHVHEHGKCEPPFESAGDHFNPTKKHHGYDNAQGFHAGDLPNLYVAADGAVAAEVLVRNVTLESGKPNSLLDGDGASLVVHAGADDHRSDPAGASGDRIACGAVERPVAAAPAQPDPARPAAGTR